MNGGYHVHVDPQPWSRTIDVYIMSADGRRQLRGLFADSEVGLNGTWEEAPRGSKLAPSFALPDDLAGPLIAALANVLPPDQATQRHLDDAIKVRDQLLTLVDRKFK